MAKKKLSEDFGVYDEPAKAFCFFYGSC